jgi:predicted alpha-1,6-mannanase (GH76 family)
MTSKWPLFSIDHRDRNRANNRWKNLRRSTRAVEWCNQTLRSDNKSGVRGVSILSDGRYEARIKCEYAGYYLGKYASLEEAAEARYRAERDFFGRLCATSDRRCRTPLALASEKGRSPAPQAA